MGNILLPASATTYSDDYLTLPCFTGSNGGGDTTRLVGGLPGYVVLENVWYKDQVLYFVQNEDEKVHNNNSNSEGDQSYLDFGLPGQDEIFTAATSVFDGLWGRNRFSRGLRAVQTITCSLEDQSRRQNDGPVAEGRRDFVDLEGTSFFLNDGWSVKYAWSGYSWYYHFVTEVLMGGISALSSASVSADDGQSRYEDINQSKDKVDKDLLLGWTHSTPATRSWTWTNSRTLARRRNRRRHTDVCTGAANSTESCAGVTDEASLIDRGASIDEKIMESYRRVHNSGSLNSLGADRLIVPWDHEWTGRNGLSPVIAKAIFGETNVLGPEIWEGLTRQSQWVHFHRVLIADRKTAERYSPWSHVWKKYSIDVYGLAPSANFFEPVRSKLLRHWGIPAVTRYSGSSNSGGARTSTTLSSSRGSANKAQVVNLVYVNRQASNRRFSPAIHQALLEGLYGLRGDLQHVKIKVKEAVLEHYSIEDQVALFANADIIVGIHGNGLSHEVWMPPGGIVIEILPPSTFRYDFAPVSQVLGHGHIIWRNDTIFPREKWWPRYQVGAREIHDGSEIPLHIPSFMAMLKQTIHLFLDARGM
ncbi:hypothetical protein IAU59_000519 [Kwoniella sp. CBS 9459]